MYIRRIILEISKILFFMLLVATLIGCSLDTEAQEVDKQYSIFEPPTCMPAGSGTCEYAVEGTINGETLEGSKDYCMVYSHVDGLYHVIGIWFVDGDPFPSGLYLHHGSSPDLVNWTIHDEIDLRLGSGVWNNDGIWAPQIVFNPEDKLFYMFYTGVVGTEWYSRGQRIGCVKSSDLFNWTPVDGPDPSQPGMVFGENQLGDWCEWVYDGTGTSGNPKVGDCRDPHVFWNPDTERWNMIVSVLLVSGGMGQAVAESTDLINWTSLGVDDRIAACDAITHAPQNGSESASIIQMPNGKWLISWTNVQYGGSWNTDIRFCVSDDLVGANFVETVDYMPHGFGSEVQYIGLGSSAIPVYSVVAIENVHMWIQFKQLNLDKWGVVSFSNLMDCDIENARYTVEELGLDDDIDPKPDPKPGEDTPVIDF